MRNQDGFSLIKLLFWLAVIASVVWYGYNVIPVYSTYESVQDAFKSISRNMANDTEGQISSALPDLFHVKYISHNDLPPDFYANLKIKADGNTVDISSHYHVTVWLLGPVQGVDPKSDYNPDKLRGMDRLRNKFRLNFNFSPHAVTP